MDVDVEKACTAQEFKAKMPILNKKSKKIKRYYKSMPQFCVSNQHAKVRCKVSKTGADFGSIARKRT